MHFLGFAMFHTASQLHIYLNLRRHTKKNIDTKKVISENGLTNENSNQIGLPELEQPNDDGLKK